MIRILQARGKKTVVGQMLAHYRITGKLGAGGMDSPLLVKRKFSF